MCLIITGQSSKVRSTLLDTTGMLSEIYSINPMVLVLCIQPPRG